MKRRKTRKKIFPVAVMMLMSSVAANAAMAAKQVKCEVDGKTKMVKSVAVCQNMDGKVG